jgi:serine/threonine protein phosphatase PrpC
MTENPTAVPVETASVTDRGLSEKRPLNEDSMLSDPERRIFAVADGVGGAQAGEVASQTAIEVLGEAFRDRDPGEDIEDLMEIAIQRANDSIYRLSREQAQFAMMATTIVALHLDGLRATIGHVGDSRLYRLTPDGHLRRETEDHSLVEEEVRAGRLTPEQAANHPGRNVISRALGAEESVEVDMKTVEVENGSVFLLCSDGITRHIPDAELSTIIRHAPSLEAACEEMKRICYERGAEDNLTAVLVRVGGALNFPDDEDEVTLVRERETFHNAPTLSESASPLLQKPFDGASSGDEDRVAASRAGRNAPASESSNSQKAAKNSGGVMRGVGVLFLVLAAVALAFYVGMMFDRKGIKRLASAAATPSPTATPVAAALEDPEQRFDRLRRAVDLSPTSEAIRMTAESNNQPLNSDDPEFLYLYGRAMFLTDRQQEAATAFDRAIQKINENMTPRNGELKIDAGIARVAAQVRGGDMVAARAAAGDLGDVIRTQQGEANSNANSASNSNAGAQPSPGVSP